VAKEFSKNFYKRKAWKKLRQQYFNSVNGLCERCLSKGLYVPGDEVHHKVTLTPGNINDPNITLNWDLLELLCFTCHQKETWGREESLRDGLMFNENGELVKEE